MKKDNNRDQDDEGKEGKVEKKSYKAKKRDMLAQMRLKETNMLKELGKDAITSKNDEIIEK